MTLSAAQVLCVGRDDAEVARRAEAIGRDVDEPARERLRRQRGRGRRQDGQVPRGRRHPAVPAGDGPVRPRPPLARRRGRRAPGAVSSGGTGASCGRARRRGRGWPRCSPACRLSMAPLGILLLVQHERGSYALAGLVTGAFTVGTALGSPTWGRAMDRVGQARVIVPTALAGGVLLTGTALAAVLDAPLAVLLLLALGSGVAVPPISAAMRSAWRVVLDDEADQRAGYVLDAVAVEAIFVGGPVVLSVLLVVGPPVLPLLVTAALLVGGGLAYSASRPARTPPVALPEDHTRLPRREPAAGARPGAGAGDGRRAGDRLRLHRHLTRRDRQRGAARPEPARPALRRDRRRQRDRRPALRHAAARPRRALAAADHARRHVHRPARDHRAADHGRRAPAGAAAGAAGHRALHRPDPRRPAERRRRRRAGWARPRGAVVPGHRHHDRRRGGHGRRRRDHRGRRRLVLVPDGGARRRPHRRPGPRRPAHLAPRPLAGEPPRRGVRGVGRCP
nr:MFS transporter [Angustibacter aerolatus]